MLIILKIRVSDYSFRSFKTFDAAQNQISMLRKLFKLSIVSRNNKNYTKGFKLLFLLTN